MAEIIKFEKKLSNDDPCNRILFELYEKRLKLWIHFIKEKNCLVGW